MDTEGAVHPDIKDTKSMGNSVSFTNIVSTSTCTLFEFNIGFEFSGTGGNYNLLIDGGDVNNGNPIFTCVADGGSSTCTTGAFYTVVNDQAACAAAFGAPSNPIVVPGLPPLTGNEIFKLEYTGDDNGGQIISIMDQFGDGTGSWGPGAPVWASRTANEFPCAVDNGRDFNISDWNVQADTTAVANTLETFFCCGDGTCTAFRTEDCDTCPADCDCDRGFTCNLGLQ